ncbi:MAG: hypothetical protein JSV66_19315 [Trueperaceae bacterium]|nr:MAG: hypothetical protein JSV66_19315 [Trueperaceae bacterium]
MTTPWYLFPFVGLWLLMAAILTLTGRLIGIVVGLTVIAIGLAFSLTMIGAVVGVPVALLGLLLITRSLF